MRNEFLTKIGIKITDFDEKYFIYDSNSKLHISESEWNYILISTIGLVAFNPTLKTDVEKIVYACSSQYEVMMTLFEKIEELKSKKDIYDIDSYHYGYLSKLTTGLSHNIIFYLELFAKAYIALNGSSFTRTHDLKILLNNTKEIMFDSQQNDSLFHAQIFLFFESIINNLNMEIDNFKEHFVKYNDCEQLKLLIDHLKPLKDFVELSNDFIIQFYYDGDHCSYLGQGLFNKLINMAKNDSEKERIKTCYKKLIEKDIL